MNVGECEVVKRKKAIKVNEPKKYVKNRKDEKKEKCTPTPIQ